MRDINKELCYTMHKFVSEHINEIDRPASSFCETWKDEKDMLKSIKRNAADAGWSLTELCTWGMKKDYTTTHFLAESYVDDEGYDVEIFKIVDRQGRDRYFKIDATKDWMPTEVRRVSKMVEIISWEEQK